MANNTINFTKATIEKITPPLNGRSYYYDTKEKGLLLDVTKTGHKSFYLYAKISGKPERIKLGTFPDMTVEQARKAALNARSQIQSGKNPNDEKKRLQNTATFGELCDLYLERYAKKHKKTWEEDQRRINKFARNWRNKKTTHVTKKDIQVLHEEIGLDSPYEANRLLSCLSTVFNKGIEWGMEITNPCTGIKKHKERSRDRFIQPDEFPRFWEALSKENNPDIHDYIMMSLLTGARKSNVLSMTFGEIDWSSQKWRIPETKNGESQTIHLTQDAVDILQKRREYIDGDFVFPSSVSKSGHLQDPKKGWARLLQNAGIKDLRLHDLRRTFGSYQVMTGATTAVIGKSLNHKTQTATAVYARMNLDVVAQSVEKATQEMLKSKILIKEASV